MDIDQDLYSRQIGTYGLETMGKVMQLRILVSGLRGTGAEIVKNLVLAGPKSVTLLDNETTELRDLGANFFLHESHAESQLSRASSCVADFAELNQYVEIRRIAGPMTDQELLKHDVVVFTDFLTPQKELLYYNELCRKNSIGFIIAISSGLCGHVFVDFGDTHVIHDKDGEESKSLILQMITPEGNIYVHEERRHLLSDNDYVKFSEVQGMEGLNGEIRQVKVISPFSFAIGDISGYGNYEGGGSCVRTKVPETFISKSLAEFLNHPAAVNECMPMSDFGKIGRAEELHVAYVAVLKFQDIHDCLPKKKDLEICLELARNFADERQLPFSELVVKRFVKYADCTLSPVASFIGGVAAQEVLKFTGDDEGEEMNDRYSDLRRVLGAETQARLEKARVFLVGCGALGCEFLKQFAMLGIGTRGSITVTDMDAVQVSNLSRQFLFRRQNVGELKSVVACRAAKKMNCQMLLEALDVAVEDQTEDVFDEDFFENLDFCVNALDNIQSRRYVDERCIWFEKPLFESGTLGTKGNTQVVLPFLTETYSDSRDPPEEQVPICTLKNYPYQIEHCIDYARDFFQGQITAASLQVNQFLESKDEFFRQLEKEGNEMMSNLEQVYQILSFTRAQSYFACVQLAVEVFQENFHFQIAHLLRAFPRDFVNPEGQKFWSGPKRAPSIIQFNRDDDTHVLFVRSLANIFAEVGQVPFGDFDDCLKKCVFREFREKILKTNEEGEIILEDDMDKNRELVHILKNEVFDVKTQVVEFEKDDDSNFHVDFVHAFACLRAKNYSIQTCDRLKTKIHAGKIIPAIATTTSAITGLVVLQILNYVKNRDNLKLENFRNSFLNLATPFFVLSEPVEPPKRRSVDFDPILQAPIVCRPEGFTTWDKMVLDFGKPGTVQDFVTYFRNQELDLTMISSGSYCLWMNFGTKSKDRLKKTVEQLYAEIAQKKITTRYLRLDVTCDTMAEVECCIPTVKYRVC